MSNLLDAIRHAFAETSPAGKRILLAVSGGADSVAMCKAMLQLQSELAWTLRVAHFNHGLRGEQSDADADWLERQCQQWGVPLTVAREDVAEFAGREKIGLEEASRELRYRFLQRTALENDCPIIAVAHTADDQAETVLHHIVRGTGLSGLRGMPDRRTLADGVELVRPLLNVSRSDVVGYLQSLGQEHREDPSNQSTEFTRNRLRHQFLPWLEAEMNPNVRGALLRLAQQAGEAQQTVETLAEDLLRKSVIEETCDGCTIDCGELAGLPPHLIREMFVRLWVARDWPRQRMGYREWQRLAELTAERGAASLPDSVEARHRRNVLTVQRKPR